ncbi:anti-sigma factor [Actinoplanes sp. KI2]|uniref:anti-sigma factor n=1 Tax=Actinoplanes sp. KI2 TaxID=2983315 RepID=UPI0021D60E75|nr:anti-sigma factor [Actinoplanes sp. KI2]MCU7728916.1 anti-sigma factor [Actinoplanes sp. KI2]
MSGEDIHALVGAYALDAVDDLERAAFDRHLRDCEACRAEAAELQQTAARLADGAWSVPPATLRDTVLAEIATTRQVAPRAPGRPRRSGSLRMRLTAAAAAVVAAAAAGVAVFVIQEQRVHHEQDVAEAARSANARVQAILAAPDLVVRQDSLSTGGHVTVASSRLHDAGVILVAPTEAPAPGNVYEAWTVGANGPVPAGTGQTSVVHVVENLSASSAVAVTVEPAPGSLKPTGSVVGKVNLT